MTVAEFRRRYPGETAQIEADARASIVGAAISAERARIAEICAVADQYDPELVNEAMFGANTCTADQMATRAMEPQNRMRSARWSVKALFAKRA